MVRSRLGVLVAALLLLAGVTVAGVAVAAADPGAGEPPVQATSAGTECTFTATTVFRPGLSTEPSTSSFYTTEPVPVTCHGPVDGGRPTGQGTLTAAGRIGTRDPDTCASGGEGWGYFDIEIPTDAGTKLMRTTLTFTYGGLQGGSLFGGESKGDYADVTFQAKGVEGDCVNKPVTGVTFDATTVLHDFRAPQPG